MIPDLAVLVSLLTSSVVRQVFSRIVESRKVRLKELAGSAANEQEMLDALDKLKRAELIGEVPGAIPDLSVYYVTSKGLTADREIRRQVSRTAAG